MVLLILLGGSIILVVLGYAFRQRATIFQKFRPNLITSTAVEVAIQQIDDQIKAIDLDAERIDKLEPVGNEELDKLILTINKLVGELYEKYNTKKQFTENASHELQTPLSVIHSNAELLLQSGLEGEQEYELVSKILQASNRLSRINRGLVLLSKIENIPYEDYIKINVAERIERSVRFFEEQAQNLGIEIHVAESKPLEIYTSESLFTLMLENLLKNAIRHNYTSGVIWLTVLPEGFKIANTSKAGAAPEEEIFKRFTRFGNSEESIGLGLSIVDRICKVLDYSIDYDFIPDEAIHVFTVKFESALLK